MGDYYASASNETEDQSLDYGFPSSVQMATPYSSSLQTIFSRHSAEIRSSPLVPPLHQHSKKRIRDMIVRQNNELFAFMQHPDRSPSSLGIAEAIFRKYSHEVPPSHRFHAISRELNLDASLNPVLQSLEASLSVDASSNSFLTLANQLKQVLTLYRQAGEEVGTLEALLGQKADMLDKLQQRIPLLTGLPGNEALPSLLESFETYMKEVFVSAKFEETYLQLVEAYKKWYLLREVVTLQQLTAPTPSDPMCSVCIADSITHVVAPCGHTFCTGCIRRMNLTCYLCRGPVKDRIKLFLG